MADQNFDSFPPATGLLKGGCAESTVLGIHGRIAITAAGTGVNDKLFLCSIPSDIRPLAMSTIHFDAITGLTDADLGDANDPDGLIDGQDMSTAGSASMLKRVDLPNRGKRLWELLGYAEDPGGRLDLYLTCKTDPTAAGDLYYELLYVHP